MGTATKGIEDVIQSSTDYKNQQTNFMMKQALSEIAQRQALERSEVKAQQGQQRAKEMAEFKNPKLGIYNRILKKDKMGLPLSRPEKELKDDMEGIDRKTTDVKKLTDVQRKRVWDFAQELANLAVTKTDGRGGKIKATRQEVEKKLLYAGYFLHPSIPVIKDIPEGPNKGKWKYVGKDDWDLVEE